jgi:cupin fold WbuC family metalloprotein
MLIRINSDTIKDLKTEASHSSRKRKNLNFHKNSGDPLQRMLQALNPDTYVQPHKHENPDKREVFIILEGKVAVLEFDDSGVMINSVILDHRSGNYGVEIPERTWHTLIALEKNSLVYEVKDGPWSPRGDKLFAPWAPKEGSPKCKTYLDRLIKLITIT